MIPKGGRFAKSVVNFVHKTPQNWEKFKSAIKQIDDLLKQGRLVYTYDVLEETYDNLNGREEKIIKCVSPQECVDKSDVVVFMHPTKKYATLEVQGTTVVDNWGIFSSEKW